MSSSTSSSAHNGSLFGPTPWSVVLAAGRNRTQSQSAALQKLCEIYWSPLYFYVRRQVRDEHVAQDLTQSFFVRLLSGNTLKMADPARGRFRTYLLQAVNWHLANEHREQQAIKRGGQCTTIAMNFADCAELLDHSSLTADQLFERQWAMALLKRVMERLRSEQEAVDKSAQFELLKGYLSGQRNDGGYADVAQQLAMTESACRMAVVRLRERFRKILTEEISSTVAATDDVQDEIAYLFDVLSQ